MTRSTPESPERFHLADSRLDLLVVGGGIVGAGVARDAAMRGLKVGLVEQADFASGTSSRTSRLLHGGLRYLAQGRVRLVREASIEKRIVQRIAPHLADPLPFLFPTRSGTPWSKWKLWLGVKTYDLLCGGENFGPSEGLNVQETLNLLPGLEQEHLTGAVRYYDGLTRDARLVIDTLRSAAGHGAILCNYAKLEDATRDGGYWSCSIRPADGASPQSLTARTIVNATGPWSDRLPQSGTELRVTKGVHLVIDHRRLPLPSAVVMPKGERILFAIPWGERIILGTTDTDYEGPLESPRCDADDLQYVLDVTNAAFPDARLAAGDVISTWAGLRPLVADPDGGPSDISRRHEIAMREDGWWDVAGGKLTTHRLMAEQTLDQIVRYLDDSYASCQTAEQPLLPPDQVAGLSGIVPPEVSEQAVRHYCQQEWARHLDDVMTRRSGWTHYHADRQSLAAQVASWMAEILSWSSEQTQQEIEQFERITRLVED